MEKVRFDYKQVNKEKLIDDLMDNPLLNNFFIEHDLNSDTIERFLLDFMSYDREKKICEKCNGLHDCQLSNKGLTPVLKYQNDNVIYNYTECDYLKDNKRKQNEINHIDAMHLPSSILQASLDDFDFKRGENKTEVLNKMTNFIRKYKEQVNGLYLYGRNNVGKTYCLSALATELMKNDIDVVIAYYPDLVREFKSRVADNSLEDIISKLKKVEVLMLDDIGGEGTSVWVRDEVLGPILQYRLLDHKPTFFTSNYPISQLVEKHFAKFTRDPDKVNAARIGIRISSLTKDNQIQM
jgi:primosomal protein DnaI